MPDVLTTDDLIVRARDIAGVPNTGVTGTNDAALLRYLSDVLHEKILPSIYRAKQNYGIRNHQIALVATQRKYRFPPRAVALKLENICRRDSAAADAAYIPMSLASEDRPWGGGEIFSIEGNYLVLDGTPTGCLEVPYFISPGSLVLSTACRQVTAVNSTFGVSVGTLPATVGSYDIVSCRSGGEPLCIDLTLASSTATSMDFNEPIDGSTFGSHPVSVGDWICAAETTCIPPIPRAVQSILVQAAVVKLVEAAGDMGALQIHGSLLKDKLSDLASVIADRVESKPERFTGIGGILRR